MREIGIGNVGGGYMGKAHAVAMHAVGAVFGTALRPRLVMVAARTPETAETYRAQYGFERGTDDWQKLVADPAVEAVVIASGSAANTPRIFTQAPKPWPPGAPRAARPAAWATLHPI